MWTTLLLIAAVIFLVAVRILFTVHNQIEATSAGLVATACFMIALGISPLALKLVLLVLLFGIEWWCLYGKPAMSSDTPSGTASGTVTDC